MEKSFWHQKWERNEIAFHEGVANPLLVKYFNKLSLENGSRVFLPLCGKSLDIPWLLSNGIRAAGAELSKMAVEQLFLGLGVEPMISRLGEIDLYSATNIDIFVGDIFDLSREMLGPVDAVYDRAALVALPTGMRNRYAGHITDITDNASQLLICYEYDQNLMSGPPFSIYGEEVKQHYGDSYCINLVATEKVPGGLKGTDAVNETVWLLNNQACICKCSIKGKDKAAADNQKRKALFLEPPTKGGHDESTHCKTS